MSCAPSVNPYSSRAVQHYQEHGLEDLDVKKPEQKKQNKQITFITR
jgi:hypothetical protein